MYKLNKKKFNKKFPNRKLDWKQVVYYDNESNRLIYKYSMQFKCLWLILSTLLCVLLLPVFVVGSLLGGRIDYGTLWDLFKVINEESRDNFVMLDWKELM